MAKEKDELLFKRKYKLSDFVPATEEQTTASTRYQTPKYLEKTFADDSRVQNSRIILPGVDRNPVELRTLISQIEREISNYFPSGRKRRPEDVDRFKPSIIGSTAPYIKAIRDIGANKAADYVESLVEKELEAYKKQITEKGGIDSYHSPIQSSLRTEAKFKTVHGNEPGETVRVYEPSFLDNLLEEDAPNIIKAYRNLPFETLLRLSHGQPNPGKLERLFNFNPDYIRTAEKPDWEYPEYTRRSDAAISESSAAAAPMLLSSDAFTQTEGSPLSLLERTLRPKKESDSDGWDTEEGEEEGGEETAESVAVDEARLSGVRRSKPLITLADPLRFSKFNALSEEERTKRVQDEFKRADYETELVKSLDPEEAARRAASRFERQEQIAERARQRLEILQGRPKFSSKTSDLTRGVPSGVDVSFAGTPGWYGGPEGVQRQLIEQAMHAYQLPYETYGMERIAPLSSSERVAHEKLRELISDPTTNETVKATVKRALESGDASILRDVAARYLEPATSEISKEDISRYMNPYDEEVINRYAEKADRDFYNKILPRISKSFFSKGALRSGEHDKAVAEAANEHEERKAQYIASLRQRGFEQAFGAAERDKARSMQGAELSGRIGASDLERRMESARLGQALQASGTGEQRLNIDALQALGARARQLEQSALSMQYEDWLRQRDYPYAQIRELSSIINRMEPRQHIAYGSSPVRPESISTSPFTVAGALLGQGAAQSLLGTSKAEGGRIGYFEGGAVQKPDSEILIDLLREKQSKLSQSKLNPFGGFLRNLTTGMVSTAPGTSFWDSARTAIPFAMHGYDEVQKINEANEDKIIDIQSLLAQSQEAQKAREEEYKMKKAEWEANLAHKRAQTRILEADLDLMSSSPAIDKKIGKFASQEEKKLFYDMLKESNENATLAVKKINELNELEKLGQNFNGFENARLSLAPSYLRGILGLDKETRKKADLINKVSRNLALLEGAKSREELDQRSKSVPNIEMQREAYFDAIKHLRAQNNDIIVRNIFLNKYKDIYGTIPTNYDYAQFKEAVPILDEEGNINESVISNLDKILNSGNIEISREKEESIAEIKKPILSNKLKSKLKKKYTKEQLEAYRKNRRGKYE